MKHKRQTRFVPIRKVEPVGAMVAGDRRKMMEAYQQAMKQEAELRRALLTESLSMLREMRQAMETRA